MTRKYRLLVIVIFILLLLGVATVYRHKIIQHMLCYATEKQTGGKVILSLEKTYLDLTTGDIILTHPVLKFNSGTTDSTFLQSIEFKMIVIKKLSFFKLLLQRQFFCATLQIEKPMVHLFRKSSRKKNSLNRKLFDPFLIMKILHSRTFGNFDLIFDIEHTGINYGKVHFFNNMGQKSIGSANYSIAIEGLKTIKQNVTRKNLVVYTRMSAALSHFHYSFPKNLTIEIDTASYRSDKKELIMENFKLHRTESDIPLVGLNNFEVKKMYLSGVKLDRKEAFNAKILHFGKLKIENASVGILQVDTSDNTKVDSHIFSLLFKIFDRITLDTVLIQHLNYCGSMLGGDTNIIAKNLKIFVEKIKIDSNLITKGFGKIQFKRLSFNSGQITIKLRQQKLHLYTKSIVYSTQSKKLILNDFDLKKNILNSIHLKVKEISVDKLSLKKWQQNKRQKIKLRLLLPELSLKIDPVLHGLNTGFNDYVNINRLIVPDSLIISNGKVIVKNKNYFLKIDSISCMMAGFLPKTLFDSLPTLTFETLQLKTGTQIFNDSINNLFYTGKRTKWEQQNFIADAIHLKFNNFRRTITMFLPHIAVAKPDINQLIFRRFLTCSHLTLWHPYIALNFPSGKETETFKNAKAKPFKMLIDNFLVDKGKVRFSKTSNNDTLLISGNLDFSGSGIRYGFGNGRSIISAKQWKIMLAEVDIEHNKNIFSKIKSCLINQQDKSLSINNFTFENLQKNDNKIQTSTSFVVRNIEINNINYAKIWKTDSLLFDKITINAKTLSFYDDGRQSMLKKQLPQFPFTIIFNRAVVNLQKLSYIRQSDSSLVSINNLRLNYYPLYRRRGKKITFDKLLMHINFSTDGLTYQLFTGKTKFAIRNISFSPENSTLNIGYLGGFNDATKSIDSSANKMYFRFASKNISIHNIKIGGRQPHLLSIGSFDIPRFDLTLTNDLKQIKVKDNSKPKNFFSAKKQIFKAIAIDSLLCNDFNLHYQLISGDQKLDADSIGIIIKKINLDSSFSTAKFPKIFESMYINTSKKSMESSDGLYRIGNKAIRINLPQRSFVFDSITVIPNYETHNFFEKAHFQTDRISMTIKELRFDDFDVDSLIKYRFFNFGILTIDGISLEMLRDKRFPLEPGIYKKMPLEMISSVPFAFNIDSVKIRNALFTYGEFADKSDKPGKVFFTNFYGNIYSITNSLAGRNHKLTLKGSFGAKIMGDADFHLNLYFPYFSENSQFWFDAKSEQLNMSKLNDLTRNLMGINIRSGKGQIETPLITGNKKFAKGKMTFKYHRLKFGLYNRKKAESYNGIASSFINFMLNDVMVRSNNPRFFGKVKNGIVYFKRDTRKSFINFIWKSVLSGILSTMGFNNKQQRLEKKEYKKIDKEKYIINNNQSGNTQQK